MISVWNAEVSKGSICRMVFVLAVIGLSVGKKNFLNISGPEIIFVVLNAVKQTVFLLEKEFVLGVGVKLREERRENFKKVDGLLHLINALNVGLLLDLIWRRVYAIDVTIEDIEKKWGL